MYSVKEIFYTLQGEGTHTGRPAVFVRFSGCNLWSGREQDRQDAICSFCDTDFVGTNGVNGGQFATAKDLAGKAADVGQLLKPGGNHHDQTVPFTGMPLLVVLTGGEPLLQVDEPLVAALKQAGFFVAIESNGTISAPSSLDWVCISPKTGSQVVQRSGNELKVVFGQKGLDLPSFLQWDFEHFYLQPMDGEDIDYLTAETIAYCKAHPQWKLSLQSHKILDIP